MNFVGIDVSGKSFLMQVNTEHKRGTARCVDNTPSGHKAALKALRGVKGPAGCVWKPPARTTSTWR